MKFFEAVNSRHSYRGPFTGDPVPDADLVKIVEAGIKAPSAGNRQTTNFVIVNNPEVVQQIAALAPNSQGLGTCQAIIVVLMDWPEDSGGPGMGFHDYSAAVENMLLAITALGYASVWTEGMLHTDEDKNAKVVADMLGVPSSKKVRTLLPVGVPAEPLTDRGRKPFDERTSWNQWGS